MNKRGSHVGVILSFVIFVTFVIFLYLILSPELITERDKESFLDYLRYQLMDEFSTNLTSITVSVDGSAECVVLKDFFNEADIGSKVIVKDDEGEISDFYISLSNEDDLVIDSSKGFFKVYEADEFEELSKISLDGLGCTELTNENGYSITLIRETKYVFESKVLKILDDYNDDESYKNLIENLKVSEENDFGFNFIYSDETVIETKERGTPGNVYVREIPVEYVDKEANILLGKVNIKVW